MKAWLSCKIKKVSREDIYRVSFKDANGRSVRSYIHPNFVDVKRKMILVDVNPLDDNNCSVCLPNKRKYSCRVVSNDILIFVSEEEKTKRRHMVKRGALLCL